MPQLIAFLPHSRSTMFPPDTPNTVEYTPNYVPEQLRIAFVHPDLGIGTSLPHAIAERACELTLVACASPQVEQRD